MDKSVLGVQALPLEMLPAFLSPITVLYDENAARNVANAFILEKKDGKRVFLHLAIKSILKVLI